MKSWAQMLMQLKIILNGDNVIPIGCYSEDRIARLEAEEVTEYFADPGRRAILRL